MPAKPSANADATLTLAKTTLDRIQLRQTTLEQAVTSGELKVDRQAGGVRRVRRHARHVPVLVQHRHAMSHESLRPRRLCRIGDHARFNRASRRLRLRRRDGRRLRRQASAVDGCRLRRPRRRRGRGDRPDRRSTPSYPARPDTGGPSAGSMRSSGGLRSPA